MRTHIWIASALGLLVAASASIATAQGPGRGREDGPRSGNTNDLVARMMVFDKDQDGALSKAEVTDERLHRLFDRADENKDGSVTKEELTTLESKAPAARPDGPPGGGPGGFMRGGFRPGDVLPAMLQDRLELSADQKKQLAALQKEVDASLAKILNDEQKAQLKAIRERGPGGPGGPGGRGRLEYDRLRLPADRPQ
ncbi:EF hand [Singulisphaera sp. GP187]|uniref:EF-hand domain-containing protein n=1 Tax=Singulisphaera sp. GP187 TaxID=1882752 RepID=UPI000928E3EB|nr:EF-hand domain-containing protein [Singulisphaera sp. GP187]SIO62522.1 EF hand [Singulisphaera sp. GP187]